jgi:hypothetical protein
VRERRTRTQTKRERDRDRDRERALEADSVHLDSVQLFCASASVNKIQHKYFSKCLFLVEIRIRINDFEGILCHFSGYFFKNNNCKNIFSP